MNDLIEALQIFAKYQNLDYPTWCSHDTLHICGISPVDVSPEDRTRLRELGFHPAPEEDWYSYRFGSA